MGVVTGKFLDAKLDDLSDVDISGAMVGDDLLVHNGASWQKGNFLAALVRDFLPASHVWEIPANRQLQVSQQLTLEGTLYITGGLVRID